MQFTACSKNAERKELLGLETVWNVKMAVIGSDTVQQQRQNELDTGSD